MTGYDDEIEKLWQPPGSDTTIISSIELGITNTWVKTKDELKEEYDLRLSVKTKEDVAPVQSLTVLTPTGTSFKVERGDEFAMDQIDPEFGIEIIRAFELQENEGAWTFSAIASSARTVRRWDLHLDRPSRKWNPGRRTMVWRARLRKATAVSNQWRFRIAGLESTVEQSDHLFLGRKLRCRLCRCFHGQR